MRGARLRLAALCLVASGLASGAIADNSASAGVGARWLNLLDNPRSAGMGSAGVALARGAGSLGGNPAGLVTASASQQLETSYLAWDEDTRLQRLAYSDPLGQRGALGLSLDYVDFGTVETLNLVNGLPVPGAQLHPYAGDLGIAGAFKLVGGLDAGGEVRGLIEDLGSGGAYGSATDLGLRWAPAPTGLALGLAVRNLGSSPQGGRLPQAALLGAAWIQPLRPGSELRVAADLRYRPEADESAALNLGAEYAVASVAAFRAGYQLASSDSPAGPSAGLSIDLGSLFSVDYAFNDLGGQAAHQLGLRAQWGAAPEAMVPVVPVAAVVTPTPPETALTAQVTSTLNKLMNAVESKDTPTAQALTQDMAVQAPALRQRLAQAVRDEGVAPSVFSGDFQHAESYLRTMTRLQRDNAYAWMALGTVLWFRQRDAESLECYQKAYLLDPSMDFVKARIVQLGGTVPTPEGESVKP